MRGGFAIGKAGDGAHQAFAVVAKVARLHVLNHQEAVALLHGRGHAVLQPHVVLVRGDELVDDHFHVVVLVSVQLHAGQGFAHLAIHADVEVAFLAHLLEEFLVMSLAVAHQGSQDVDALVLVVAQDKLDNLLLGVLHHLLAGQVGVGFSRPGIKQAEEVVNLGRGAHGGARVLVRGLLLDGDDRAEPRNLVHIRTLQVAQEIPGIRGEGLDVAPLPFGKERVERQRRLSASAQPGNHRQAVAGDADVDVLQIVHAGTIHFYIFLFLHRFRYPWGKYVQNYTFPPNTHPADAGFRPKNARYYFLTQIRWVE